MLTLLTFGCPGYHHAYHKLVVATLLHLNKLQVLCRAAGGKAQAICAKQLRARKVARTLFALTSGPKPR